MRESKIKLPHIRSIFNLKFSINFQFSFIAILILLFIARIIIFYQNRPNLYDGQHLIFETTLFSQPQILGKNQRFTVEYKAERIFIVTSLFPQFNYADKFKISGNLKISLLENGKTFKSIVFPKIEAGNKGNNQFLSVAGFIRQNVTSFFQRNLSPTASSLLLGIIFGIKESIPKDFLGELKISGVLHVIAASGMNVTMVAGFLSSVFSLLFKRQIALVISIVGILFYAVLAGGEPSIIRASVMGILVFTASILGRQAWAIWGLLIAAYVMLFINPNVIFDIGFQLSFLATLGLIYISPIVQKALKHEIFGNFATTISAQAATLPVLLANFGTYSLWSVVVNGLVLWTVPVLMVLGGLAVMIGFILEPIGKILLFLALPLLLYFEKLVSFFAHLGGFVEIENLSWSFIVGYYMIVLSIIMLKQEERG